MIVPLTLHHYYTSKLLKSQRATQNFLKLFDVELSNSFGYDNVRTYNVKDGGLALSQRRPRESSLSLTSEAPWGS